MVATGVAGDRAIGFIERFCSLGRGAEAASPIVLRPWQRQVLTDLLEEEDGRRRYRTGLIGLPRKNGKSVLGAGLALYGLVADGEAGAEVYACAGDRQQARIVFGEARRIVQSSEALSRHVRVYRDVLEVPATHSIFRVLSADAKLQQGLTPHMVVFDEVHVQPSDDLWNAMVLGMGTRRNPLMVGITTAGYGEDSLLRRLYEYGKRLKSGEMVDTSFYFQWWEPSTFGDWRDPAQWREANPALGDYLRMDALEHDSRTTAEAEFRRYHLNQWTASAQAWLPYGAWQECLDADARLDPALPLKVGIDMAYSNDAAAVVGAQVQGDRTVISLLGVWENPHPPDDRRHGEWKINVFEVEDLLRRVRAQYPVAAATVDGQARPGPEFAYDPAWFSRSAPVLEGDGLTMVEFPQSDARMVPASQTLYQLVTEKRIAHAGEPALRRHVENAIADRRPRGWRLSKSNPRRKIDAAIALAIAAYRAQEPMPGRKASIYETRGVLVL